MEFIHGYGMAALSQGYIVKVYDLNGQTVWDAQNHDMTQCRKLMEAMAERMQKVHSQEEGGYMEAHYNLMSDGVKVGTASVGYYGPYSMSEGDFRFLDALNKMLVSMALIPDSECSLELVNGLSPIVMNPCDGSGRYSYMVLPVRLKAGE